MERFLMAKKRRDTSICPACGGIGSRVVTNYYQCETVECSLCEGTGIIDEHLIDEHLSSLKKQKSNRIYL